MKVIGVIILIVGYVVYGIMSFTGIMIPIQNIK